MRNGHRFLFLLIVVTASAIAANSSTSGSSGDNHKTFLWLSDIHLDPFYGTDQAIAHNKLGDED